MNSIYDIAVGNFLKGDTPKVEEAPEFLTPVVPATAAMEEWMTQEQVATETTPEQPKSNFKTNSKFGKRISKAMGLENFGREEQNKELSLQEYMYGTPTPMAEGGAPVVQAPPAAGGKPQGETGFVGTEPENATEAETVADDVPVDVPEGTFVLNAPAVEFMGSADVKKMILDATKEAEKQGIDITQNNPKISRENLASLIVSKGEVLIQPELANIIGYDRLEKINNRGKREVEKRIQENGQSPEAEQAQAAAFGGDTAQDTEIQDIYESLRRQDANVPSYEVYSQAMERFRDGKVYRPMQSASGSEAFDAEVKSRYGLFFDGYDKQYMTPEEVDATSDSFVVAPAPLTREREDGSIYYIDPQSGQEVAPPQQDSGDEGFAKRTPAP